MSLARAVAAGCGGKAGDLGRVVIDDGRTEYFHSFLGIGSPYDWVRIADSRWMAPVKRLGHAVCYPLCSLAVIAAKRSVEMTITIGDEPQRSRLFALLVGNGRWLGGGML